jgi:ATP-dependent RNA helicase DHX8/PRP22
MNGNEVNRWIEEWDRLLKEINHVNSLLSKSSPIRVQEQNIDRKKALDGEKSLIERRLKEFESAMECILKYLEEKNNDENGDYDYDYDYEVVNVFRFGEKFDWEKIYNLIVRERCRFEEGLPIYAYRREILQQLHHQKVLYWNLEIKYLSYYVFPIIFLREMLPRVMFNNLK